MRYLQENYSSLDEEYRKKNTFWRRWIAVIILFSFFFLSWTGQFVTQMQQAKQQAEQHSQQFQMSEF